MKTATSKIAVFSGAAVLTFAFGLGGVAHETVSSTTTATPSTSAVSSHLTSSPGSGDHITTLAGCIPGLNC